MDAIDVAITVDTEFSLGRTFQGGGLPVSDERVHCRVNGRPWGLAHLLERFAAYDLRVTFFIEALHVAYFGDGPMGAVVERVMASGHDVQLHLHPQWWFFAEPAWRENVRMHPPADNCEGRSESELCDMIGQGTETFRRWGAAPPVALRTGGLRVDRTVYRAMARMGLRLASNVGWGLWEPNDEELRLAAGRRWVEGVMEVPVVTYRQPAAGPLRPLRLCTITATSRIEMDWLLQRSSEAQISPFVILTHPFEFVRYFGAVEPRAPSRINLARLEALCRFLACRPRQFRVIPFSQGAIDWPALPPADFAPLRVPVVAMAARVVENKINDAHLGIGGWRQG